MFKQNSISTFPSPAAVTEDISVPTRGFPNPCFSWLPYDVRAGAVCDVTGWVCEIVLPWVLVSPLAPPGDSKDCLGQSLIWLHSDPLVCIAWDNSYTVHTFQNPSPLSHGTIPGIPVLQHLKLIAQTAFEVPGFGRKCF